LCVADHGNDPAILARWLNNKTQDNVASWIAQPGNSLLVAVEHGTILAVGSVTNAGEITLNYVSPDARFRGVSRALLGALEARAVARGNARCTLKSTETAREFYLANGYVIDGPADHKYGPGGYPMSKLLPCITRAHRVKTTHRSRRRSGTRARYSIPSDCLRRGGG
jgi:GNAT superfamily N-acetyltransferase